MAISIADNTLRSIPFFSENQVLKARDLNNLVDAVLDQLRQNRIYNIGLGVVEGFSVSWDDELNTLVIERGFGVSSDGYGFDLDKCAFTHVRKIGSSFNGYTKLAGDCDRYDDLMTALITGGYELGAPDPKKPIDAEWSILAGNEQLKAGEYCLIYLYREEKIVQASCFSECEGKGAEQAGKYHAVLLPREAYLWVPDGSAGSQIAAIDLPDVPQLLAFGRKGNCVELCKIGDWPALYESYHTACVMVIEKLTRAYGAAQLAMEPLPLVEGQSPPTPDQQPLAIELKKYLEQLLNSTYPTPNRISTNEDCTDIQYCYTYVQELIVAYAAIYHLLEGKNLSLGNSNDSANANIRCRFPGYLGIGCLSVAGEGDLAGRLAVKDSDGEIDVCRTERILPDTSTDRQTLLNAARELLVKMKALAQPKNLLLPTWQRKGLTELHLTPSARRFPFLQGRALPFYYKPSVMDAWRVGVQPNLMAYRYAAKNDQHPALYADNIRDFYRIEGHLGFPLVETTVDFELEVASEVGVKYRLEELRDCYNLAFDVVAVNLDLPEVGKPAPPITGSARDAWYKNTRADLLQILVFCSAVGRKVSQQAVNIDRVEMEGGGVEVAVIQDRIIECCLELTTFLTLYENLHDLKDWEELTEVDFCKPLPTTLTSAALTAFVECYKQLSDELEALRSGAQFASYARANSPRLDPALGECIRDEAIKERLACEAIWRNRFLAGFARTHPGLVHRGGVENGGTVVLVYKDQVDRTGLIQWLKDRKDREKLDYDQLFDDDLLKRADEKGINVNLFKAQTVVADFSLPYLCCGAGPVHLHMAPPVPVTITVAVGKDCISADDLKEGIPVNYTVSEAGGKITFSVKGNNVDEINTGSIASGPVGVANVPAGAFADGRVEIKAHYELDSRSSETVFEVIRQPTLALKSLTFLEAVFQEGQNFFIYELFLDTDASLVNPEVYADNQLADYDQESGRLRVLIDKKGEMPTGRVSVGFNNCNTELPLDFCEPLPRSMTLKADCNLVEGECKLKCQEESVPFTDSEIVIQLDRIKQNIGVIELCPVVPGGRFSVEAFVEEDFALDFNPDGLVLVKPALVKDDPICQYHLVLDFNVFNTIAIAKGDPLSCYRDERGLFPFQLRDGVPRIPLVKVVLSYSFGECNQLDQKIIIEIVKGGNGPVKPDPDGQVNGPVVVAGNNPTAINATLNARSTTRQKELAALGESDASLTTEPAFRRVFSYLSDAGEGANPKSGLDATLKALKKLVETTPERIDFVRKSGKIVATSFLDKLAVQKDTKKLTAANEKLLINLKKSLAEIGISTNAISKAWGVSKLYGGPDKDRLSTISSQLKKS